MWGELTMCTIVHTLMVKSGNQLQVEPTVWILKSMISDGTVKEKLWIPIKHQKNSTASDNDLILKHEAMIKYLRWAKAYNKGDWDQKKSYLMWAELQNNLLSVFWYFWEIKMSYNTVTFCSPVTPNKCFHFAQVFFVSSLTFTFYLLAPLSWLPINFADCPLLVLDPCLREFLGLEV